jgi:hypothetical protein
MQEVNERQSKEIMQQTNHYKSNSNKLFQEGRKETPLNPCARRASNGNETGETITSMYNNTYHG